MTQITWSVEAPLEDQPEVRIAIVRFNRPDKRNAITIDILKDSRRIANLIRKDRRIRAVILTGDEQSFSSGLDFGKTFTNPRKFLPAVVPRPSGGNLFQEGPWAWRRLPIPVIAAVQGHCYGAGIQYALAADFRFTTPDSKWSLMEARWGLIPDMSGMASLKQLVPIDVAKRLVMTGEIFSGEKAVELGIATELADDPLTAATQFATELAQRSPDAVSNAKKLIDSTWNKGVRGTFIRELRAQVPLLAGKNSQIARKAKGEAPHFRNRKVN